MRTISALFAAAISAAAQASTDTSNLLSDPGFESGTSTCTAQSARDSVLRSTQAPIDGTASLVVALAGNGKGVACPVQVDAGSGAVLQVAVSALVRAEISSRSALSVCALAGYADGTSVRRCALSSKTVGTVSSLSATVITDAARRVTSARLWLEVSGAKSVRYAIDDASVVLTLGTQPPSGGPAINAFAADPPAIAIADPQQSTTLSWSVTGASTVSIDNGIGNVAATGTRRVSPTATTTYTLTASNGSGSATAKVTVPVVYVSSFTASPSPVASGGAVTLSWTVAGATGLSIDNGVGAVAGTSLVVHPAASTTWTLTASNGPASFSIAATVTVNAAAPQPLISSFAAEPSFIAQGASTTLRWASNAAAVTLSPGGSFPGTGSVAVSPSATTTYTLVAGSATATATVTVGQGPWIAPGTPAGAPAVTFSLDSRSGVHPISPLIYGYNAASPAQAPSGASFLRLGGNRWTAYDWETNASNAGADYLYQNDTYLSASNTPAAALLPTLASGLPTLVTLALQGFVAGDVAGPVVNGPPFSAPQRLRFLQGVPRKGAPFGGAFTGDAFVYQDELAALLRAQYPSTHYSLDNEPELWSSTHAEIQYAPLTYAALFRSTIDLASAVKDAAPQAPVLGPVSYGFAGFVSLQNASDADPTAWNYPPDAATWFLDSYLRAMRGASEAQGRRLLDVLDVHWYSEARGRDRNGTWHRVTEQCATCNDTEVRTARIEAPRSLWDAAYACAASSTVPSPLACENSWVANYFGAWGNNAYGAIRLLHWLRSKIDADWPGTKIAFTEYSHGGGNDISGAVAQADTLGIFGREGVYAATNWPVNGDERYIFGAFRSFRNFDGAGGAFGDTSFSALSSDQSRASVYASYDAADPGARVVVVAINKTAGPLAARLRLAHTRAFAGARVYQLLATSPYDGASLVPQRLADVAPGATNAFDATLPGYSITTFVLVP